MGPGWCLKATALVKVLCTFQQNSLSPLPVPRLGMGDSKGTAREIRSPRGEVFKLYVWSFFLSLQKSLSLSQAGICILLDCHNVA